MIARTSNATPAAPIDYAATFVVAWDGPSETLHVTRHADRGSAAACPNPHEHQLVVAGEADLADQSTATMVEIFNHCFKDTPVKKFENAAVARRRAYRALCERWGYLPLTNPKNEESDVTTETQTEDPKAAKKAADAEKRAKAQAKIKEERAAKAAKAKADAGAKKEAAAKAKAEKTSKPKEPKPLKSAGQPAGQPSAFRQVREGSARQRILELMTGSHTAEEIAARVGGVDANRVLQHAYCLTRDCAVGFSVSETGHLLAIYPRGLSYADAVKPAPAPKTTKAATA